MGKKCKNCGTVLHGDNKFCPKCGTEVRTNKHQITIDYCPNCGSEIKHDEEYCQNCGTNLISEQPTPYVSIIEKYKFPIILLATLIILVVIVVGTIMLMPHGSVDVGTQTITVGTTRFEIPGDYRLDPSSIDIETYGYSVSTTEVYSNGDESIGICIMTIPYGVDGETIASANGGSYKNLMGKNGYYNEFEEGYSFFDGASFAKFFPCESGG